MQLLRTPIKIRQLELKNRLVMPPMATAKATAAGHVTPQICDYYAEKSIGGAFGLIITEHSYISAEGQAGKNQLSIADDTAIDGLSRLTETIHKNNSPVMAQISHAGGAAKEDVTGRPTIGASSVLLPRWEHAPAEMTESDIQTVIHGFTAAAVRAKKAGFDGVELHSAHGYLLNQFYSPLANRRTDSYGPASVQDRTRLHVSIIKAVRAAVGDSYPLAMRLGACDYTEGGTTLQDSILAARIFEEAGIDLLDISGGFCGYVRPGANEQGYFRELSAGIKAAVHIPVILTGGVTDVQAAETLLEQEAADLIGIGRAVLKDSCWAQNALLTIREPSSY